MCHQYLRRVFASLVFVLPLSVCFAGAALAQISEGEPPPIIFEPPPVVVPPPEPLPPPPPLSVTLPPGLPPGYSIAIPTDVTKAPRPVERPQTKAFALATRPGNFVFATSNCNCLGSVAQDFAVRALRGSMYSIEGAHQINLARGRMLVMAGGTAVDVVAGAARVSVRAGSSAIVETGAGEIARVYALSGPTVSATPVEVVFPGAAADGVPVLAGRELVVAASDLSEDELIPVDGLERRPIEGSLTANLPKNAHMKEFSLRQMNDYDALLTCRAQEIEGTDRLARLVHDSNRQIAGASEAQEPFPGQEAGVSTAVSGTIIGSGIGPGIGSGGGQQDAPLMEQQPGSPTGYRSLVATGSPRLLAGLGDAEYELSADGTVTLNKGALLVMSKEPTMVKAEGREVICSGGAMALVKTDKQALKVVNLTGTSADAVAVMGGGRLVGVQPATEMVISSAVPSLASIYDVPAIGHSSVASGLVPGLGWVTTSRVSLGDLLLKHPVMVALRASGGTKLEARAVDRALKTAAIQNTLRSPLNNFRRGVAEDTTGASMRIAARCNRCLL